MIDCWSTNIPFMGVLECFQRSFLFQLKRKIYIGEQSEKGDVLAASKEGRDVKH